MIAHVDNRITYNGNGNATEFAYQFKILDRTDIKVLLTDADGKEKLLTKDYYVDVEKSVVRYPGYAVGAEVPEGERPAVLPTGWKLTIYREVPVTQETDLPDQYPFNQVEDIGDKLTMIAQQLTDVTGRSLKIGVSTSADIDTTIPWENGKSFRISDDGKTLELSEDPAKVLPLAQSKLEAATAQANIAAASAAAAAKSEDSAAASASEAGNSAQSASVSAASAAESARLAEGYKNVAETAKSNASLYAANAKTSADNAGASKEAAQSAATTASNFASDARNSADEAKTYKDNAKTYMDNAKNYSENVNVFIPSVSSAGVLSWTNKAGLTNPASVNIKGAKGDTGTAASITIGSVTTGAAGSNASVTNSGTASNVVLNFMLPRGKDGKDGGITVDAALSDTSTNPVQNKVVKAAIDSVAASVPTKVSTLENDAGYLTQHQSLDNYAKTNQDNNFSGIQTFQSIRTAREDMPYQWDTTTPTSHCGFMIVSANTTIDLSKIFEALPKGDYMAVYTCIIQASNDYSLTITGVPNVHYIGSASDCSIKAPGVLLNVLCWRSGEQGTGKDVCVLVSAFS